jgi:hypothetical protein
MRVGAFDYLRKPVDIVTLRAAVARALSHHEIAREREELFRLLVEEREQLRARVDAATSDIRQYAEACERSNQHLRTLLRFAHMSAEQYSEESMFREVFAELSKFAPVRGMVLCDPGRRQLVVLVRAEQDSNLEYYRGGEAFTISAYDTLLAEAEPEKFIRGWLEKSTPLDLAECSAHVYPQVFWNRASCTVAFYLAKAFEPDASYLEFLDAGSYFLAFEWERSELVSHVAHEASLANIAVELARSFIQPLTAIQTASDFIQETLTAPDARQGMRIIVDNVERLRRQTQEFRKLALLRENAVETVRLNEYVEQALDMLSVAIQSRSVTVEKEFVADSECVLLNGTLLTRTFLNLILDALRAVDLGGKLRLRLAEADPDHMLFEIGYTDSGRGVSAGAFHPAPGDSAYGNPSYLLAERAVHSCGGSLSIEVHDNGETRVRIVVPRNATTTVRRRGVAP